MVVANNRLSICPPWLAEGGLITKAFGGAPDSWEGEGTNILIPTVQGYIGILKSPYPPCPPHLPPPPPPSPPPPPPLHLLLLFVVFFCVLLYRIIPTSHHTLMPDASGSCSAAGLTADASASGGFAASLPPPPLVASPPLVAQTAIRICSPPSLVDCCFGRRTSSSPIASPSLSSTAPLSPLLPLPLIAHEKPESR